MRFLTQIMEDGADRYEIISHKGEECDCGYTTVSKPISKWGNDWNVLIVHKSTKQIPVPSACRLDTSKKMGGPCG